MDATERRYSGSHYGLPTCYRSRLSTLDNIMARLVKLLFGIRENMEMAKAGQRHRLQLTPHKRTPLVVAAAAAVVFFIAFKIGKLGVSLSVKFSRVLFV